MESLLLACESFRVTTFISFEVFVLVLYSVAAETDRREELRRTGDRAGLVGARGVFTSVMWLWEGGGGLGSLLPNLSC